MAARVPATPASLANLIVCLLAHYEYYWTQPRTSGHLLTGRWLARELCAVVDNGLGAHTVDPRHRPRRAGVMRDLAAPLLRFGAERRVLLRQHRVPVKLLEVFENLLATLIGASYVPLTLQFPQLLSSILGWSRIRLGTGCVHNRDAPLGRH